MLRHSFKGYIPDEKSSRKKSHRIKMSRKPGDPLHEYSVEEFENISGMVYLSGLAFKNKKIYLKLRRLCEDTLKKKRFSERAKWLGSLYKNQIDQAFVNDVSIKWVSKNMGYGCFAEKLIKKDEYIGEYTGLLRPCTFLTRNLNEYCFRYPLYRTFFIVYTIDAKMQGNEMSFINHSNSPNCEAVAVWHGGLLHMCLVALEDIQKDDQLFFDYGNKMRQV